MAHNVAPVEAREHMATKYPTKRIVELNTSRAPESMQKDVERPSFVKTVEQMEKKPGRTMERNTTSALESLQEEEEKILSEKPAVLQSQLEVAQHAAPPLEEQTNIQTSLQTLSEKLHTLQVSLQNLEASREQDLQILREEMECRITKNLEAAKNSLQKTEERLMEVENKLGRIMEFFREEMEGIITKDLEEAKKSWTTEMEAKLELIHVQQYKVDVTLDADTAHPRLRVSEDGKSVTDTGAIRRVSVKKKRFVYQAFVLAKEGYKSGTFYWEVDVGKRRNWILGVAQETVKRKEVVLSPQNGFWAIALADGQDYWVHTDPWTRLTVSGRPQKIGIFLDISAKKLSFYSVHEKKALYTFTFDSDHSQDVKLFPFFSTGSTAIKADTEPLRIAQGFHDDEK
nr:E3 ubiquitin-protein ligase TRIM39-like [Anser cygnoides]